MVAEVRGGDLAGAAEAIAAGIYGVDRTGQVLHVNATALELLGYQRDQVVGRGAHDLWHFVDATGRRRPAATCPITAVARRGVPESWSGDVFVRRDGSLLSVAWTSVPVVEAGESVGAVVVFHDLTGRRDELRADAELPEVRTVDPAAASEAARTAFLTDITLALISTLDVDEALARLARILVPRFADWCVIDLVETGGMVRRVALAHRQPSRVRLLGALGTVRFPLPDPPGPPLARVLRGVPSVLLEDLTPPEEPVTAETPVPAGTPVTEMEQRQAELFAILGARQALVVGLQARTSTIGAVTMVRERTRLFTAAERALAEDIALRAGIAVDNARLYTDTRSTAETLQRSLLPVLPTTSTLTLAATYVPAGHGAEVGGDWYDAFDLGHGVTGVALGDVAGHDLEAATRMSDLRTLLRAASLTAEDPAAVLESLDRSMAVFSPGVTATAVFGRVGPGPDDALRLVWSNAGHPPPLLVTAGGDARFLEADPDPLLGAPGLGMPGGYRRRSQVVDLAPGSMVVLYTDGLVEDRDTGLEPGMARLRQVAAELAHEGPEALSTHLLPELGRESADDIAVLVLGAPPSPARLR